MYFVLNLNKNKYFNCRKIKYNFTIDLKYSILLLSYENYKKNDILYFYFSNFCNPVWMSRLACS